MENQITTTSETAVRLAGEVRLVPDQLIARLPEIVKREVLFPKLRDDRNSREEATNRIISMLSVNFVNEQEQALAMMEFGSFLRTYSLTKEELYEAYRMAIKKELQTSKGDEIKVFPTLSIIQAGEILNAYMAYKQENRQHTEGMKLLRTKEEILMKESPEEIRENCLKMIFHELTTVGFTDDCWVLYPDVESKISVTDDQKKAMYKRHERVYLAELEDQVRTEKRHASAFTYREVKNEISKGSKNNYIINRCKNELVQEYLLKHIADYETFLAALK